MKTIHIPLAIIRGNTVFRLDGVKPRPNNCNILTQHCWVQHVACAWPPCCDVLYHVGCCWLKFETGQIFHATFAISFPESSFPLTSGRKTRALGESFWNDKGNNRILPIQFHYAVCIYGACLKWLLPELSFSDRWSKGTKTLGTRLATFVDITWRCSCPWTCALVRFPQPVEPRCNSVAKCVQHVTLKNVGICCIQMFQSFGRSLQMLGQQCWDMLRWDVTIAWPGLRKMTLQRYSKYLGHRIALCCTVLEDMTFKSLSQALHKSQNKS